jgi:hypothetical protein
MAKKGDPCEHCAGRLIVGGSSASACNRNQYQKLKCNRCGKYAVGVVVVLRESILPRPRDASENRIT